MSEPTTPGPTLDELLDRNPEGLAAARQRAAWAEAKAAPPAPVATRRRRWGPVVLVALTVILAGERAANWLMREERAVESLAP